MNARLPIIYVRGYAGPSWGIDEATDDAFYGFNAGSTHIRVDGDGRPRFHQFESPLLRLIADEDYHVMVRGGQADLLARADDGTLPAAAVWIYRFYDAAAGTFGERRTSFDILKAAEGLYKFIQLVRQKTEGGPKVYLVAHSMGGLVCRAMLQRVCRETDGAGERRIPGDDLVAKLLTMGTPHNGIDTEFALVDLFNRVAGIWGSEIFDRHNMYNYLTPGDRTHGRPDDWRANEIDGFEPSRVFCVIGTNATDWGAGRMAIGARSDGLVRIDNAYVRKAPRAFVHRSHTGRYGLVDSEESYQSLRRFLFGSWRVEVDVEGLTLPDLDAEEWPADCAAEFDPLSVDTFWQADVQVTIRRLPVVLHEQSVEHHCPVQLTAEQIRRRRYGAADSADTPVPLTTVFLLHPARFAADRPNDPPPRRARYTMRLRLFKFETRDGLFDLRRRAEQVADWEDALIVDIGHSDVDGDAVVSAWVAWNSTVPGANADHDPISDDRTLVTGGVQMIDFPASARAILGSTARLQLRVTEWE